MAGFKDTGFGKWLLGSAKESKEVMVLDNRPPIKREVQAYLVTNVSGFALSYTGEKNLGSMGPAKYYTPEYETLRIRSYQSYIESEITKTIINKFRLWVIGDGLKLKSEPNKVVLKSEGIDLDTEAFNEIIEARFTAWGNSNACDYTRKKTLGALAESAFTNSIVGGDVLVLLRVKNGNLSVQLVDGSHVQSPSFGTDTYAEVLDNGNRIRHGVEISPQGEHVAYHVLDEKNVYQRFPVMVHGVKMAFLVCGLEYRLDNTRGVPLVATILETLKKIERYKEAAVGGAEERQKIAYTIERGVNAPGDSPLKTALTQAIDPDHHETPVDESRKELAKNVATTFQKQVFDMPEDTKLVMHKSDMEALFKEFYETNAMFLCASVGIPYEVALSKFDNNFSSSRAALKDWEHTVRTVRSFFSQQFYQPIYNAMLMIQILQFKISAPGYLIAFINNDFILLSAYQTARFTGANIPHVDPLKEVKAIREKLGPAGKDFPLITGEGATEEAGNADFDSIQRQFALEKKDNKKLIESQDKQDNKNKKLDKKKPIPIDQTEGDS